MLSACATAAAHCSHSRWPGRPPLLTCRTTITCSSYNSLAGRQGRQGLYSTVASRGAGFKSPAGAAAAAARPTLRLGRYRPPVPLMAAAAAPAVGPGASVGRCRGRWRRRVVGVAASKQHNCQAKRHQHDGPLVLHNSVPRAGQHIPGHEGDEQRGTQRCSPRCGGGGGSAAAAAVGHGWAPACSGGQTAAELLVRLGHGAG